MPVRFLVFAILFFSLTAPVWAAAEKDAEKKPGSAIALPDRIIRPAVAIDPITLRAEGVTVRLWGIKPALSNETPLGLKALALMDTLIQEQQVNCKIVGGALPELVGRCSTQGKEDLALELINSGYAVVDRLQTYDSVFASAYEKAQETARLKGTGVWEMVAREKEEGAFPSWLKPHMATLVPLGLVVMPFGGLFIIALVMGHWMSGISRLHQGEIDQARKKEATLEMRERQVLISTLEGELLENRNKIEAFLVIYGDMLRGLKENVEQPKYQQGGDIVQKHPSFSKTVFEANVNRLSALDIKLAGHISKLYSSLPKEQEYINLDQNVPLDTAVKLVEKVLKDAQELLEPINVVIRALQAAAPAQA